MPASKSCHVCFRGLILRVQPGTIEPQAAPFGLAQQGGDFDCRDQRRLPYCHPDLTGQDWFTDPVELDEVIYVTVHQQGNAATVMNYTQNFGEILAMGGFLASAEFSNGTVRQQVAGQYCNLPCGEDGCQGISDPAPDPDPDPERDPEPENQLPEAEFTANCTELSCSFDGSGSSDLDGTIVSHAWDFGDTNAGSGPTPSHTYAADGNYLVTLTVTDDDGATDSTSGP